jgi:4-hydroxy-3-methylbut-2-enyl diphosphate reductase
LLVGDAQHPEVEAIRSYIKDKVEVVNDVQVIKRLGPWGKLGVIAQTTQSFRLFKEVVAASLDRAKEIRVFNTICPATAIRQKEAVEIAKKVDCMIVVGGYNSGNTQRLVSICKEIQPERIRLRRLENSMTNGWQEIKGRLDRRGIDALLGDSGG